MNSFERFNEGKLPAKNIFIALQKMEKFGDDGKISE